MQRSLRLVLILGGCLVTVTFALFSGASASPPPAGSVSAGREYVATTSVAWAAVPNLAGIATTSAGGCVVATLSTEVFRSTDAGGLLLFRAIVDESTTMEPGEIAGGPSDAFAVETTAFTFWQCNLSRGTHPVVIEWRSNDGYEGRVRNRTLVVEAR